MNKKLIKIVLLFILIFGLLLCHLTMLWIHGMKELTLQRERDCALLWAETLTKHPIVEVQTEFIEPNLEYLGNFKLTYYCACEICCGKTDGITATGTKATAGRTIAVDPRVIPYGSKVLINGHVYTAEDCGGAIKENRIDVYMDTHTEACQAGVSYADVYLFY